MNTSEWKQNLISMPRKKAVPVLSFPCVQLLGVTVKELIMSSELQAAGMKAVADRVPSGLSVSLMDLSVEAECFGTPIYFSDHEVPTVKGPLFDPDDDEEEHIAAAEALKLPEIGTGRTGIYIEAMSKAVRRITDRPVLAGVIGPFSLAGRLADVTNSLIFCLSEPEYMHLILEKCTEFIIRYIRAYKETGAAGVMMAEPLAGLLSPALAAEFSGRYCRRIVEAVKDESFLFVYHNCGNTANVTLNSIISCGADAYHFGDAVNMEEILEKLPPETLCLGNVSPAFQFRHGTPESIRQQTLGLMEKCCRYPNFVVSSGCDIPPLSPWENIDAFFSAVEEFYGSSAG